ncbi:MAG: hypothetical protein FWE34_07850 [Defluviitaleaceae bacterium]|nr:hypothetical protein [Defluviitaleaceae bacterium]
MDNFKKTLKRRNIYNICMIAVLVAAAIIIYFSFVPSNHDMGMFIIGILSGLTALLVALTLKNCFVMRNNKKLQAMHIKENDERQAMILQKTGATLLPICAFGLGIAAVTAMFFNPLISLTLISVIGFMALIKAALRLYYGRKL